jgi:hypothetical protein
MVFYRKLQHRFRQIAWTKMVQMSERSGSKVLRPLWTIAISYLARGRHPDVEPGSGAGVTTSGAAGPSYFASLITARCSHFQVLALWSVSLARAFKC